MSEQSSKQPAMIKNIQEHKRVNDILLGPLERPALQWLAAHMPRWITSDRLTAIGFFGSVVVFGGYWLTMIDKNFLWLASLGFVINWFGDSLDGTLARYRHTERPIYGFFIDHTVDAVAEPLVFMGLGLSPYVRFDLAMIALVGYLILSVHVYLRTLVEKEFKISYGKLGPTEVRMIAIMANTIIYFAGNPVVKLPFLSSASPLGSFTVYDVIVAVIAFLLYYFFFTASWKSLVLLARVDVPGRVKIRKAKRRKARKARPESEPAGSFLPTDDQV